MMISKTERLAGIFSMAAIWACTMAAPAQQKPQGRLGGFSVSPAIIREAVYPGRQSQIELTIQNFELRPVSMDVKIESMLPAPWTYASRFGVSHPRDCSAWF